MRIANSLVLAVAALVLFVLATIAATTAVLGVEASGEDRALLLVLLALLLIGLALLPLKWAHRRYLALPLQLADQARLLPSANRTARLRATGGPWDGLVGAVNALADQRDALERDVEAQIASARADLEEEKNRLAALMSELAQSVVVCNLDGRVLLYNNRARQEFAAGQAGEAGELLGLGRSIFSLLERERIVHALEALQRQVHKAAAQPLANFVTATASGRLIRVHMAPVMSADEAGRQQIGGYVLLLDNITRAVEKETRRDLVLQQLTEGSRAALANIRAAVETLQSYQDMEPEAHARFLTVIKDEVSALGGRIGQTLEQHADSLKSRWPLEEMAGSDLLAAAQRRIEARLGLATRVDELDERLWLHVDSYSLIQAISYIAARLKESFGIRLLRFRLAQEGRLGQLDLIWTGAALSSEALASWEGDAMQAYGEDSPLSLHDVIDRHGGEIWFQRERASQQAYFRLLLPTAPAQLGAGLAAARGSRPEYYDFDLFKRPAQNHGLDERQLLELSYTVFDTETTGLEPSAGDEIIQIGAVRLVNGRLLRQECFEQLIDPHRFLPPQSVAVHGIEEAMLVGAPSIEQVLPKFHRFCEDTVLVAHNAAFDMRFLALKEEATGVRFVQPVLDTLLLSAIIHPHHQSHRLEAIAERLGVDLLGRHTALGDAIVTGEVFLKMLPLLQAMGINTLKQALAAAQETYYARLRY